jgi:hypothetical protein
MLDLVSCVTHYDVEDGIRPFAYNYVERISLRQSRVFYTTNSCLHAIQNSPGKLMCGRVPAHVASSVFASKVSESHDERIGCLLVSNHVIDGFGDPIGMLV